MPVPSHQKNQFLNVIMPLCTCYLHNYPLFGLVNYERVFKIGIGYIMLLLQTLFYNALVILLKIISND